MADDKLEPLVTQCPNCDTRFRVSETQLQVAAGKVRCGACLHVFDGTAYLLIDGEPYQPEAEDVDALLEEIESDEAAAPADAQAAQVAPPLPAALTARLAGAGTTTDLPDGEGPGAPAREETGAAIDEAPAATAPDDDGPAELARLEDELLAALHDELGTASGASDQPAEREPLDVSAAFEVPPAAPRSAVEIFETDVVEDAGHPQVTDTGESAEAAADDSSPAMHIPQLSSLVEEDLAAQLEAAETPRRRVPWATVAVMLLCALGIPAQVLFFRFDTLARDTTWRPIYQQVCAVAGCELPLMSDVARIQAENSVLRQHPEVQGALVFDALIVNQAAFEQAFPLLELTLTSLRGHLVAGRRFAPEEYLRGELARSNLMPPGAPVHISLELEDPGQAPLNFNLRFLKDSPQRPRRNAAPAAK